MSPFRAIFHAPPWARKFFLVGAQKKTASQIRHCKCTARKKCQVGKCRCASGNAVIRRYLSEYVVFTHSHTNSLTNSLTLQGGCVQREKIIYIKNIEQSYSSYLLTYYFYILRYLYLDSDRKSTQPYPRPNVEEHAVRLAFEAFCNHFVVLHNCIVLVKHIPV